MSPRLVHEGDDAVYACPSCDDAGNIYERSGNGNAYKGNPDDPYICQSCSHTFVEPVKRDAKDNAKNLPDESNQGLTKVMADLTVEEFDQILAERGRS